MNKSLCNKTPRSNDNRDTKIFFKPPDPPKNSINIIGNVQIIEKLSYDKKMKDFEGKGIFHEHGCVVIYFFKIIN
jgi:hypothetical protein